MCAIELSNSSILSVRRKSICPISHVAALPPAPSLTCESIKLELRRIAVVTNIMDTDEEIAPLSYADLLDGRFEGILRWPDLDALWLRVKASGVPWYIYEVGMDVPDAPIVAHNLDAEIGVIDKLLHENHKEDYCGIVYVDDPDMPTLIKVFGPKNLGASCGSSGSKTWPRWILSHIPPTEIGIKLDDKGKPAWWKAFSFKK